MSSINELLKKAAGILIESRSTDTPMLDAELIFLYAMNSAGQGIDRVKLITKSHMAVPGEIEREYLEFINERSRGKPVQYITGIQEFMGCKLYISEGVLIPRPETEIVAERAIELVGAMERPVIIDMCTGSGAIAISLASVIQESLIWASDISDRALDCCRINVERSGLENRIRIVKGDLFAGIADKGLIGNTDMVISNPPYIKSGEIPGLRVNVRGYEPLEALDGGLDGLSYYRRIAKGSMDFLKPGGILIFEVGYDQGQKVKNIMKENNFFYDISIESDLAGYDRCVWGRRAQI